MKVVIVKKLNYHTFLTKKKQLTFKFVATKIRLVLPTLNNFNREVLLNDGLPLEFILNGHKSSRLVDNCDIEIIDLSSELFPIKNTFSYLNSLIGANKTENIVIVSLSGKQNNDISGGINTFDDVEVPVIFTGPFFVNKTISNEIIYTINDLAITINNFYGVNVDNARGHLIKFFEKNEKITAAPMIASQSLEKVIEHVIIFASDAFASYLIKNNELNNIKRMMNAGIFSLNNHAVIPTVSAVNWNSFIRAMSPNLHGFTQWNSFPPEIKPAISLANEDVAPSLFHLVKAKNPQAKTCAFFRWPQWQHIIELDKVDYYYNLINEKDIKKWGKTSNSTITDLENNLQINEKVVNEAIKYISKEKPFLSLIYVNEPDTIGHDIGHQTIEINDAAKKVDNWVGNVLKMIEIDPELKNNTLLVFTGDHGGVGVGSECHGGITPNEFEVPLILFGAMINKFEIKKPIIQYDFIKTLAFKLNLDIPKQWNGRILPHIFKDNYPLGLVLFQRDIGTYALYENGHFIFLMLGYNESIKRTKLYGKQQKYNNFKYYDIEHNLLIKEI